MTDFTFISGLVGGILIGLLIGVLAMWILSVVVRVFNP
jgi:NhaP-type Na+/H+ or K+/H+ antiporter